jgi:hypothetical protein
MIYPPSNIITFYIISLKRLSLFTPYRRQRRHKQYLKEVQNEIPLDFILEFFPSESDFSFRVKAIFLSE